MIYRRLPNTDTARLKALKILLSNDDIYTIRREVVGWQMMTEAQTAYDRLQTANEQYRLMKQAQARLGSKADLLQHNALLYASHFLRVLFLAVERKEVKKQQLELYGLSQDISMLPYMKNIESLFEWVPKIIKGEKQRIKSGGRPIYNPTIGMVSTHFDIFKDFIEKQQLAIRRTQEAAENVQRLRISTDELIQNIWDKAENYYADSPIEARIEACRKIGVVYYDRKNRKKRADAVH